MKSYEFYYDEDSFPRARFVEQPPQRGLIGLFLQMEVGRSLEICQLLLTNAREVWQNYTAEYEETGNLFLVVVRPVVTRVENVYEADDWVELTTSEFIQILIDWQQLLQQRSLANE